MSDNNNSNHSTGTKFGAPSGVSMGEPESNGSGSITLLLILNDENNRHSTRAALEGLPGVEVVGERSELRSGLLLARQLRPRVVLLDLPDASDEALVAAGSFKLDSPDVALFLMSNTLDPQVLLKAIRAGAQEVLKKPLDKVLLQEAVERVSRSGAARSAGETRARSIITVFGPKGGVGTSTIAANLAVSLKMHFGVTTALADFDLASGDAAHLLGLKAEHSIADLVRAPRIDSPTVHMNLLHHKSGTAVLAQPEDLNKLEIVTPAQAGGMVDALSSSFEVVVIDAPHTFDEVSLELFDRSTSILVVLELSVPGIRAARRALDVFDRLHYTIVPDRVKLIVNRYSRSRALISLDQLAEALQNRAYHTIENDYQRIFTSVNAGRPLCLDDPDAPAARDITALAGKLIHREAPVAQVGTTRKGLFGRMGSR
jgi:pilus assembly protein CpaE